jgi:coenzyme F420-reducing hydrogenase delta subunit/ferredoxin
MWLHIQRVVRADVMPTRTLAVGTLVTLAALSFALPALSQAPADVAAAPSSLPLDWWLLFLHPAMYRTSPATLWVAVAAFASLTLALPWLVRAPRPAVARVSPENCNGCGRCFVDCPFGAVVIGPRTDAKRAPGQARVIPELCVACGICAGACPSSTPFRSIAELVTGIDMPQRPLAALRDELERSLAGLSGGPRIVVFGCDHGVDVRRFARADTGTLSLLCAGQLPPSFVEYALRGGADGVLVAGCERDGCLFRLGDAWTAERLAGRREPHVRASVSPERVRAAWTASAAELGREIEAFRTALRALPARAAALPPRRLRSGTTEGMVTR